MKNLWAPWRMAYIDGSHEEAHAREAALEPCIFCRFPRDTRDRENLILHRAATAFVILNRFPYSNGHLMIVPYAHASALDALEPASHDELFRLTTRMTALVRDAFGAEGMNVGMNLGQCAGAGVADHLHVHVVPRWSGDTNFMPVLGEVKVINEHLLTTYDKLAARL